MIYFILQQKRYNSYFKYDCEKYLNVKGKRTFFAHCTFTYVFILKWKGSNVDILNWESVLRYNLKLIYFSLVRIVCKIINNKSHVKYKRFLHSNFVWRLIWSTLIKMYTRVKIFKNKQKQFFFKIKCISYKLTIDSIRIKVLLVEFNNL